MDKKQFERRKFISIGAAAVAASILLVAVYGKELLPTAKQVEGPFFLTHQQIDKDADMTSVPGGEGEGHAKGQTLIISDRVMDIKGNGVENAPVTSALDVNFQY
jgi:protocatechuate 3,4-dioxygenase beta subunit